MIYLISMFECRIVDSSNICLHQMVPYEWRDEQNVVYAHNSILHCVNFSELLQVKVDNDLYCFLFKKSNLESSFWCIKHRSNNYYICLNSYLTISFDGKEILKVLVDKINFSHSVELENNLILFFNGVRNFIVVLSDGEAKVCSYYDEINNQEKEIVIMCKLNDCLNHGRVYKIGKEVENYLVYLDDNELNLKSEFVGVVFLDCLIAKNYNYCNSLLTEEIKQEQASSIKEFFPEFDFYVPIKQNKFILINKNALAGICEFEVSNNQIVNIIHFQ